MRFGGLTGVFERKTGNGGEERASFRRGGGTGQATATATAKTKYRDPFDSVAHKVP
jgi:hypothetical protein